MSKMESYTLEIEAVMKRWLHETVYLRTDTIRKSGSEIFHAVHDNIDVVVQQSSVQFLREDTLDAKSQETKREKGK